MFGVKTRRLDPSTECTAVRGSVRTHPPSTVILAVIDQFKILMFAMLIVSPLVLFLRKLRTAN